MDIVWWICWAPLFMLFFSLFLPILRKNAKNTPLDILERRFLKGEISMIEYEKRKRILEIDSDLKIRQYLISRHSPN
jgi:putative membrane protein